jgi:hypothetical protein
MNLNDRILYLGPSEGGLVQNRVYRWLGDSWEMLIPPTESNRQNASYYVEANGDVTEGAPDAVFSFAQIRSLVASSIFANLIGAKNIILNTDGSIQSENYVPGISGFIIYADGRAEFNEMTVRNSIFLNGDIISGPLVLRSEEVMGQEYNFPSGTVYEGIQWSGGTNIQVSVRGYFGERPIIYVMERLTEYINVTYPSWASGAFNFVQRTREAVVTYEDGTTENAWSWYREWYSHATTPQIHLYETYTNTRSTKDLRFRFVTHGSKTFKLIGLSETRPTEPNIVYKSGGILRIS